MAFDEETLAIPVGSLILVTGANGYIGSHVCDQLLLAGYRVRGTVRSLSKSSWMAPFFTTKFGLGTFELAEVPEMSTPGAFDGAAKGTSGVVHTSAPITVSPDPNIGITSVVSGVLNILSSASKEPLVRRVVLTSSSVAAFHPVPNVECDVDESSWNEEDVERAWAPPPYGPERRGAVYCASKVQSEQAAWQWMREHQPHFILNAIVPCLNIGKVLSPANQGFPSTAGWIKAAWDGFEGMEYLKAFPPQSFVDVVDVARVHVAALAFADVKGERLFTFAGEFTWNDLLAVMRRMRPGRKFIDDLEGLGRDRSRVKTERAEELIRRFGTEGWVAFEDSVKGWAVGQDDLV